MGIESAAAAAAFTFNLSIEIKGFFLEMNNNHVAQVLHKKSSQEPSNTKYLYLILGNWRGYLVEKLIVLRDPYVLFSEKPQKPL